MMNNEYQSWIKMIWYFSMVVATLTTNITWAQDGNELIGVWEAEQEIVSNDEIKLLIKRDSNKLVATVDKLEVALSNDSGKVSLTMPDKSGKFRGKLDESSGQLSGFWIQPVSRTLNYPLAIPLSFEQTEAGWQVSFRRMHDRMRLYLSIYKPSNRPLEAFIRNPERNIGIRLGYLAVSRQKNGIALQGLRDKTIYRGTVKQRDGEHILEFLLPYSDQPFVFQRSIRKADSAFHPTENESTYKYRQPDQLDDGWKTSPASQVGFNVEMLEELVSEIQSTKTTELTTPYIHSLLISRNGKLVLEEYFYGYDRSHPHDTRSAGKSMASMLIGGALDRHQQLDENTTLASVFGKRWREPTTDRRNISHEQRSTWRNQITIGHALAMQSGLDIDDDDSESPGNEGTMQDQPSIEDWVNYVLNVPMIRQPGTQSVYGSNNINLAAAAIAEATNQWLPELFQIQLAKPLGISNYYFNLDPAEQGYMGGGIRLTARDQLKLGQVMVGNGNWNGKRILSEDWVKKCLQPHSSIHEPNDYGYGWWRKTLKSENRDVEVFHASGNGGQLIVCIPEQQLVVQMSGGNYMNFTVWYKNLTELIPKKILPALN